jgi:ATP-dependent Clp protease ATP-binding subunit ClpC
MGLKQRLEGHHRVVIDNRAIHSAVRLSERYIPDRYLPDKAIDVLDEACALVGSTRVNENDKVKEIKEKIRQTSIKKKTAINAKDYELALNLRELENVYENELKNLCGPAAEDHKRSIVKEADVRSIVEEITGVVLRTENSPDNIYGKLSKSVVGQDDAVMKLSSAVTRSFAGVNSPDRPRGVFLFLGESGVGKTKLAAALTKELFGSIESLIRYDMSEYSEGASVTKLLGASPGYVGYDDNNSPIEKIRKRPYSVVLLDEIEKANPEVLSLFLQVFDNGFLTDGTGRRISFRNCYIIMTSNACADRIGKKSSLGFIAEDGAEDVYNEIKGVFKDEFINRIDEIILFSPLDDRSLCDIAKIKVEELIDRLASMEIKLEVDEAVYGAIVERLSTHSGSGARPIERIIVSLIENELARMIVDGVANKGDVISVTAEDNNIICRKKSYAIK